MTTRKTTTKKPTTGAKSAKRSAPKEKRAKASASIATTKPMVEAPVGALTPTPVAKLEPVVAARSASVTPTKPVVAAKPAPVTVTETVVEVETAEAVAPPARVVPKHEVRQLVREAAFLFAKRRQFRNGTPTQDWLAAEAFVNERLAARGFTVSA